MEIWHYSASWVRNTRIWHYLGGAGY